MTLPDPPHNQPRIPTWVVVVVGLGASLLWAWWTTLGALVERWSSDPQCSHGFLIPVVAVLLLWHRRQYCPNEPEPAGWWGVALLGTGVLLRLAGTYLYVEWLDHLALLPYLAGVVVLVGGWPAWRWAWPALVYLVFMFPPPFQLMTALSAPLQALATVASTFTLQTLGWPATSEGNVIVVGTTRTEVVEACNGLGMLMAFFAISTAVALLVKRPLLDRIIIFLSAIPIGVVMNLLRITATAIAKQTLGTEAANRIFHDLAGWLMMPLALGALALELWFLDRLLLPTQPGSPSPVTLTQPGRRLASRYVEDSIV
jgi:exosortase